MNQTSDFLSVPDLFLKQVETFQDKPFLYYKNKGRYWDLNWFQLRRKVFQIALCLHLSGIKKGDRIAVLSEDRIESVIINLASLHLGAVIVSISLNQPLSEIIYILKSSKAKHLFVSKEKFLPCIWNKREELPFLSQGTFMDGISNNSTENNSILNVGSLTSFLEKNKAYRYPELIISKLWKNIDIEDIAILIYTISKTGKHECISLTHGKLISNALASGKHLNLKQEGIIFYFLTSSFPLVRTVGFYCMLAKGIPLAFPESLKSLEDNLQEIKPAYLWTNPQFLKRAHSKIVREIASASKLSKSLFHWAIRLGKIRAVNVPALNSLSLREKLEIFMADLLVLRRIRNTFGGKLKFIILDGIFSDPEDRVFFEAIGIPILKGFGQTEISPIIYNAISQQDYTFNSMKVPGKNFKPVKSSWAIAKGYLRSI